MQVEFDLTAARVLEAFTEEMTHRGGRVSESFLDGERRLWARSILPDVDEVRRDDFVYGGVALHMRDDQVSVFPYVFRQVCQNGAILSQTIASRALNDLRLVSPESALDAIRKCVASCTSLEVFASNVERMTAASHREVDAAIAMMAFASSHGLARSEELLRMVMRQFLQDGDRSQFGLANAFTAVARDTRDPDDKWDLEEFGGGLAISSGPLMPDRGGRRARRAASVVGDGVDRGALVH